MKLSATPTGSVFSVQNAGMVMRAYREEDFEAVYALDRVCFAPRFRFSRAMMRRVVRAPGAVVLLAWEEGELLAGFCAVDVTRTEGQVWGYVATLDVAPGCQRRGIGRELMRAAEMGAREGGAEVMMLHVYAENEAAIRLYQGLGYVRVGREVGFYGRGFDAFVYRKYV